MISGTQFVQDLLNVINVDQAIDKEISEAIYLIEKGYMDLASIIDPNLPADSFTSMLGNHGGKDITSSGALDLITHVSDIGAISGLPLGFHAFKPFLQKFAPVSDSFLSTVDFFGYGSMDFDASGDDVIGGLLGKMFTNPDIAVNMIQYNFRSVFANSENVSESIDQPFGAISTGDIAANKEAARGFSFGTSGSIKLAGRGPKVTVETKSKEGDQTFEAGSTVEIEKAEGKLEWDIKVFYTEDDDKPTDGDGDDKPTDGDGDDKPTDGDGDDKPTGGDGEKGWPQDGDGSGVSPDGNPLVQSSHRNGAQFSGFQFAADVERIGSDFVDRISGSGVATNRLFVSSNVIAQIADLNMRKTLEASFQTKDLLIPAANDSINTDEFHVIFQ